MLNSCREIRPTYSLKAVPLDLKNFLLGELATLPLELKPFGELRLGELGALDSQLGIRWC